MKDPAKVSTGPFLFSLNDWRATENNDLLLSIKVQEFSEKQKQILTASGFSLDFTKVQK